jgi:hypothetical protein
VEIASPAFQQGRNDYLSPLVIEQSLQETKQLWEMA